MWTTINIKPHCFGYIFLKAKQGFELLEIPRIYHSFIAGPNQETSQKIASEYKVKINIPPPSVNKDEVTISGDKEGVAMAKEEIMKIYKEKVKNNNYPVLLFFSSSLFCINCIITLWASLSGFLDDFRSLLVTLFVWFSGTKNNHGFHRSQKIPTQIRYWPQETSFKWDTCSDRYEFASLCMWDLQLQGWS